MRRGKSIKLFGGATLFFILVVIVWVLQTNLIISEKVAIIGLVLIIGRGIMVFLNWCFDFFPKISEAKLKHSNDLIGEVFEKPIKMCSVVYDEDKIFINKTHDLPNGLGTALEWQKDYDKNKIHQSCVDWNETNYFLKYAIQHLNHKKYERTWQAYSYGKRYAETINEKTIEKIQQYRDVVEKMLYAAKIPFEPLGQENNLKGKFYLKWIRHLIFYNATNNSKKGNSFKKLELFPVSINPHDSENLYSLQWGDHYPGSGTVGGQKIAIGDITDIEYLRDVIEGIENDKRIKDIILEIDCLKYNRINNPELKQFEKGRKEIINQVKIKRKALEGVCDICP